METKVEHISLQKIEKNVSRLLRDDTTMLEIHNLFAKMCEPYVPMEEGTLSQQIEVLPEGVHYTVPYAHYQYIGLIYGPNIPIVEDGVVVGWFSPPGQKKHPTGRRISYSNQMHPLASREWDKAMIRDKKDEFLTQVHSILVRRYRELYG